MCLREFKCAVRTAGERLTKGFVTAVGAALGKAGRGRKMRQKKIARGQVIGYSIRC